MSQLGNDMGADSAVVDPGVGTTGKSKTPGKYRGRRFSQQRCGQCGAPELFESAPLGWARWVPAFTGLVTVRCPACGWRRVRPRSWAAELQPMGPDRALRSQERRAGRAMSRNMKQLLVTMGAMTVAAIIGWLVGTR